MRSFKFIAILVVAALCSCTNDPIDEGGAANVPTGIDRKIKTSSLESEQGELLVKFSDEAIAAVETGVTRTEATRTGLQRFDAALTDIEAVSLERVFPDIPKHEAQARAFGLQLWYVVKFNPEVSLATAARKLAAADEVAYVQYNNRIVENYDREESIPYDQVRSGNYIPADTRINVMAKFNDPRLKDQWHYKNTGDESLVKPIKAGSDINLEPAWELCTGDPSIIVAVMDQGVVYNHEDLAANMWINEKELNGASGVDDDGNGYADDIYGYNFVTNSGKITWNNPDDSGHGTHVAGTISAVNNNGIGVCGIAGGSGNNDGVKIMSVQAFDGKNPCLWLLLPGLFSMRPITVLRFFSVAGVAEHMGRIKLMRTIVAQRSLHLNISLKRSAPAVLSMAVSPFSLRVMMRRHANILRRTLQWFV